MLATCTEPTTSGALAELAPARRDLYRFFSAAFLQAPDSRGLENLRHLAGQEGVKHLFSPALVEQLRGWLTGEQAMTSAEAVAAARREFTNLFQVPGGQYVPPYESVFRDSRDLNGQQVSGLLMGQSALDVQQWYRLAALEMTSDCKELPDHIGLELQYLANLCEREQEFERCGDTDKQTRAWEMERDFLKAHVCSWLGLLAEKIRAKASHPLYPVVADMAAEFAACDLATLEAVVGPSSGKSAPDYAN